MIKKSSICTYAGDKIFTVAGIQDRKKILPGERFPTSKIHLKDLMTRKLINDVEALIEGKFFLFILARFR